MPPPPLLLPLPPPPPPPTPPLLPLPPPPPPLLPLLLPPPPPPGCILGAPWSRQPSSVALSVCMGEGNEGPAPRELLGACVRGCVCVRPGERASPGAQRLLRAEPGADRGPARGGGKGGRWGREGAGGRGKMGGLGQPPAPERAWLPPSLCTPVPRGSGGCLRPPAHPRRVRAGCGAPRGRHLCATPPGPASTPGILLSSALWVRRPVPEAAEEK